MPSRLVPHYEVAIRAGVTVCALACIVCAPRAAAAQDERVGVANTAPEQQSAEQPREAAPSPNASDSAPSREPPESAPAQSQPSIAPPLASPPSGATASPHGGIPDAVSGLPIWDNVQLHGRFDVNYERAGYTGDPFKHGYDALKNYHHFLFLVRDTKDDPITFNVELISQQWYDIAYRWTPAGTAWRFRAKAGRILVPFGPDPLYHHMYGGRAGFDQQLLSVVWSQLGATANAQYRFGPYSLSNDVYAVQGYKLSAADAVLNLQSDFSSTDDLRFGVGDRLAIAYGPFALYYSAYFNALGFGRHLFMQALDFSLARFHGVPVLQHFTVDFGVIRADVAGGASRGFGGPNADYYHFADYLQIRYYPTSWLYIQGRTGIKTIDNKRGLYIDRGNLTQDDTIAHNIGVIARYHGLSGGFYYFWNLEYRNELPNDLFRLTVIYEF